MKPIELIYKYIREKVNIVLTELNIKSNMLYRQI